MPIAHLSFTRKKPMSHRSFAVALYPMAILLALGSAAPVRGADPTRQAARALTESESVRLALARPAVQALAEGHIALARSDVTAAGRWPNPEIEYARERVDRQPTDATDEFYWLSQRFELSGQRGLRTEAAEHRLRAATLGTEADRVELEADVRARFFRVLHQQERLGTIDEWTRRLSAIEEVVRKRRIAGDVSSYDALRLSREQSSAQATLRRDRASYQRLWAELGAVLGEADAMTTYGGVTGRLLPDSPSPLTSILEALPRRPDIARLAQAAEAHTLERRAGERGWIPELTLGIGRKTVDDDLGFDSGPMIAAGITVPVFDRGQAEEQRASANAVIARSEHQLALAEAEGKVRGRWTEVAELTAAARDQDRAAHEEGARLIAIAEAAYRGGELGVLELLDAYRGAYEAELQALDMAASAREARIELDRLAGGLPP